jgi:hypothetical protein
MITILFEILKAFLLAFKPWRWFNKKDDGTKIILEMYHQLLDLTIPNTKFTEYKLSNHACKEYCKIGFQIAYEGLKEISNNKKLDNIIFTKSMTKVITKYKKRALEIGFPSFFINEYDFNNAGAIKLNMDIVNFIISQKIYNGKKLLSIVTAYWQACENILFCATKWADKMSIDVEAKLENWCQDNYLIAKGLGFPFEEAGIKPASV